MTNKSKKMLLFVFIMVVAIMIFNGNSIYAEINDAYPGVDKVIQEGVDEAVSGSDLIELLAKLIYAVAKWLESIIGWMFAMLSGYSDFPWADKIVFNTIPLLDINFIHPEDNSFISNIRDVLQGLYSTTMTLAIGFFGMAVLITATKLVIASIASEKAKYKKAIVDWLVGFAMLFCIHYFIAFIFYLNEQFVIIASKIVTERLEEYDQDAVKLKYEGVMDEIIDDARDKGYEYNGEKVADIFDNNRSIFSAWLNNVAVKGVENGLYNAVDNGASKEKKYQDLALIIKWVAGENVSVKELKELRQSIIAHLETKKDTVYGYQAIGGNKESPWYKIFGNDNFTADFLRILYDNQKETEYKLVVTRDDGEAVYYLSHGYSKIDSKHSSLVDKEGGGKDFYWSKVIDELIILKAASPTSNGKDSIDSEDKNSTNKKLQVRIISDLASYFRDNAYNRVRHWEIATKDDKANANIKNILMYSVLVGQSIVLFIAYIKRLFYVTMLAMLAPLVVVVDFFQRFGK